MPGKTKELAKPVADSGNLLLDGEFNPPPPPPEKIRAPTYVGALFIVSGYNLVLIYSYLAARFADCFSDDGRLRDAGFFQFIQ